jgi:hypothetical protein
VAILSNRKPHRVLPSSSFSSNFPGIAVSNDRSPGFERFVSLRSAFCFNVYVLEKCKGGPAIAPNSMKREKRLHFIAAALSSRHFNVNNVLLSINHFSPSRSLTLASCNRHIADESYRCSMRDCIFLCSPPVFGNKGLPRD